MKVGAYEFGHVCDIEPLRDDAGAIQLVMPQSRYRNAATAPLNRYGGGPFCKFKIPGRFNASGVYILMVDEDVRYVGECANLSSRFNAMAIFLPKIVTKADRRRTAV
jgi:hypothetical protein